MIIMWVPTVNTPTPHTHTRADKILSLRTTTPWCVCFHTHPLNKSWLQVNLAGYHDEKAMSESVRRLIKGGGETCREKERDGDGGRGGICLWLALSECDGSPGGGFHSHAHHGRPSVPKIFPTCTSQVNLQSWCRKISLWMPHLLNI